MKFFFLPVLSWTLAISLSFAQPSYTEEISHDANVDLSLTNDPNEVVADARFLYPNPSPGHVQVKLFGKISIHVYTLAGQLIQHFYLKPGEKIIDLSFLAPGVYQVLAKSDEDYFSGKLIIK